MKLSSHGATLFMVLGKLAAPVRRAHEMRLNVRMLHPCAPANSLMKPAIFLRKKRKSSA